MDILVRHVRIAFDEVARSAGQPTETLRFRFAMHGWAMVMRAGHYTILHDHADAHWSLVYYVDAGDADPEEATSGLLAFVDPRRSGLVIPGVDLLPSTFTVRPRTGSIVVFPGYLQHYVHAYRGVRPRVSVSCNVRMELVGPGGAP
jgi:hypothetical protein